MKSLRLRDVDVHFGKVHALRGLTLEARAGEVLMIAGPNGAGKSTLIRVLLGLVSPKRGEVSVDGRRVRVDRALRAQLGYLPESVAFAESLSGREVVSFFAAAKGVPRARVDAVLARVGLADARTRAVRGYSRGMRQRLGLAVAMLGDPALLVLDEPTGGLDQDALQLFFSVLDEWREADRIVLLASHEIALLEQRVDRLALFSEGRIVAEGKPEELRERAALPVRVRLRLSAPGAAREALLAALRDRGIEPRVAGEAELELSIPQGDLLSILDLGARHREALADLRVVTAPFDQVYRRLLAEAA